MSFSNVMSDIMSMFGPKQQVVKPPLKKPPPKYNNQMYNLMVRGDPEEEYQRMKDSKKRGTKRKSGSKENISMKKMRKPSLPQLPLFGESMKRKSGSMESIATKKIKPSSSKRPGSAAFNPSKKMKPTLSSKRSGSLGSLENMFAKKTRI